jgi:hypothetical protein
VTPPSLPPRNVAAARLPPALPKRPASMLEVSETQNRSNPRASPGPPFVPGRLPPAPPTRPSSSAGALSVSRAPPPPPVRRANRESSEYNAPEPAPQPPPVNGVPRQRSVSGPPQRVASNSYQAPPARAKSACVRQSNRTTDEQSTEPPPPATSGNWTFAVDGLPPPRHFERKMRQYGSGRTRGSEFELSVL